MEASKLERVKPKKIYAPNKKVKIGVYVVAAVLVILYFAANLCYAESVFS